MCDCKFCEHNRDQECRCQPCEWIREQWRPGQMIVAGHDVRQDDW